MSLTRADSQGFGDQQVDGELELVAGGSDSAVGGSHLEVSDTASTAGASGSAVGGSGGRRRRSKNAQLNAELLEKLRANPGRVFQLSQLAAEMQRPAKEVSNALTALRRVTPEIANPVRGSWVYASDRMEAPSPSPSREPARPAKKVRKWGVKTKVEDWLHAHPQQIFVASQIADDLELEVKTVNEALFSLRDYLGEELQKPGRGAWRYEPSEQDESRRARLRLQEVRQELSRRDLGELAPLIRRLLVEEQERLVAQLAALQALDGEPGAPDMSTAPDVSGATAVSGAADVSAAPDPEERGASFTPRTRSEMPADWPAKLEAVMVHGNGGLVIKDEQGELWLAHHIDV